MLSFSRVLVLIVGTLLALGMLGFTGLVSYLIFDAFRTNSFENIMALIVMGFVGVVCLFIAFLMLLDIATDIKKVLFKKKCPMCSRYAFDTLTGDKKIGQYCREHLLEQYRKYFLTSPFNVIMGEYQPKGLEAPAYYYYPVSEIDFVVYSRYSVPTKEDRAAQQTIRHLLEIIKTKKCNRCSKQASVLFVSKEAFPYSKYKTTPREEFDSTGIYLCKEDALEKIIPALKASTKHFDTYEGLCLPRKEDGYQATVAF